MRLSLLLLSITFSFHLAPAQVPQRDNRPRTASISGRVTIGGKPAPNAVVMVEEFGRGSEGGAKVLAGSVVQPRIFAKVRTDGEGRYRFMGLAEGQYFLRALSRAYTSKVEREEDGNGQQVTLDDGEARENVDFAFVRGGVITGRVIDAEGRPLIATGLQLLPVNEKGEPRENPGFDLWDILETDDRGVYRLYGLPAGRYILGGGGERWYSRAAGRLPFTFHPDVSDRKQAKIIEVREGEVVENIDIRVGVARKTYEAVGRVIDAETGQPVPLVRLYFQSVRENEESMTSIDRNTVADEQGRFKITGLITGPYELRTVNYWMESSEYYSERTRFTVDDADVSGLEVKASRGATLSGVIAVEGAADPAVKSKLQQTMLSVSVMTVREGIMDGSRYNHAGGGNAKIDANGAFRTSGLPPGKVTFHLRGYGRSPFEINRIERAGAPIDRPIEIGRGERIDNLRIVVDYASGSIRGQIKIAGGALPQGWRLHVSASRVKAAEEAGELRPFQTEGGYSLVDDKGRFLLERLAPGEYEVSVNAFVRNNANGGQEQAPVEAVKQRVAVSDGAETPVTIAFDPARKRKEGQ
jgi:protocatechuate 3,4-dioxygenase beta subunit